MIGVLKSHFFNTLCLFPDMLYWVTVCFILYFDFSCWF